MIFQLQKYSAEIKALLTTSTIVRGFTIRKERLIDTTLYFDISTELIDGSELYIVEYVVLEENLKKIKYKYHWQSKKSQKFVRWDNIPHYPDVETFPYHKHVSEKVEPSSEVDLVYVLKEIEKKWLNN